MKLIATDLDGTLLNEMGEVSAKNAAAIRRAMENNIEVVVATGRSYETANRQLQAVDLQLPIISLNGAIVYTTNKKVVSSIPMDKAIAQKVQSACQQQNIYFEIYANNGVYSNSKEYFMDVMIDIAKTANPTISQEEIRKRVDERFDDENVQFITDYNPLFADPDFAVYKMLAFSSNKEKLAAINKQFIGESGLTVTSSGNTNLEFNHPDAQKGIALKQFAESRGIDLKDVMAFGDNFNDLSMLTIVGYSIAMGNAEDEIKKQCKFITKNNTEHGVAYAIEEMLHQKLAK